MKGMELARGYYEQYGDQVNIGVITVPLSEIAALEGSYDVRIELAE